MGFHGLEIPEREGEHATGGENGLHDDGGEGAGGGAVYHVPAIVELGFPVVGAVWVAKGGAVGVGGGEDIISWNLDAKISDLIQGLLDVRSE